MAVGFREDAVTAYNLSCPMVLDLLHSLLPSPPLPKPGVDINGIFTLPREGKGSKLSSHTAI